MKQVYNNPPRSEWDEICRRPQEDPEAMRESVAEIFAQVSRDGDAAVRRLTEQYDNVSLGNYRVDLSPLSLDVDKKLQEAIRQAIVNITKFHQAHIPSGREIETMPGVRCRTKYMPIQSVGLYVPGGSASLFSTVMMLVIPAQLAGCRQITLCTPPSADGVDPLVAWTARELGLEEIYAIGGAQAIAAMALGTETVARADKIYGPGNQYVTQAKLYAQRYGTAIDMPAGPSEVLVVADASSRPDWVAADLLSQAEHGADSQVMLISSDMSLIASVQSQIEVQLADLPRAEIARAALSHARYIYMSDHEERLALVNTYAPEHLIIATSDAEVMAERVTQAGSIFVGSLCCESLGDYASGTNHSLPTAGWARSYAGVNVNSFRRAMTMQTITEEGMRELGPVVETLARAEGLEAHARAVSIRLSNLES